MKTTTDTPIDLMRALAWVRDGYSHRLYVIGVDEKLLFLAGLIDSFGELTDAGRRALAQ